MTEIRNIWEDYGFSKNPYHTEHLQPTREDASLYVSREEEENQLGRFLVSEDAGSIIVEGNVGCGKTTFINQTQFRILDDKELPKILPSVSLVEIMDETSSRELVLSILTATLKALREYDETVEDEQKFKELNQYTRKALIQDWSGGGSMLGVGANAGKSTTPTGPDEVPLQTLQELLDSAAELVRNRAFEKIVVLLNNLDNVNNERVFGLLHDLRDSILERQPYLLIMSGPSGLRQELSTNRSHRRISEKVAGDAVELQSLTKEQVYEVLSRRVERYRLESDVQAPVPESAIEILYDASNGEIRYILNRADGIARTVADKLATRSGMDEELAFAALQGIVREQVESLELSERKWEILEAIVNHGKTQPKDYKSFDFNSTQAFMNYLTEFHEMKLLDRTKQGRNTIYSPRGDIRLYFKNDFSP